jgi:transcriptional regulator of acetoin/glycerol metabolism
VIEYAVAVARMETILPEDLPDEIRQAAERSDSSSAVVFRSSLPERAAPDATEAEVESLRAALELNHWRRADTAKALGLSRSTLWRRMRELHLLQ